MRKLELMHQLFGKSPGNKCKDCMHLIGGVNEYRKCQIYGQTHSEATDWALSWDACGLWNKVYNGRISLINTRKGRQKKPEDPIPGQISIFDFLGGTHEG